MTEKERGRVEGREGADLCRRRCSGPPHDRTMAGTRFPGLGMTTSFIWQLPVASTRPKTPIPPPHTRNVRRVPESAFGRVEGTKRIHLFTV